MKLILILVLCVCSLKAIAEQTDIEAKRQRLLEKIDAHEKNTCAGANVMCKEYLSRYGLSKDAAAYRDEVLGRINRAAVMNYPESLREDGRYGFVIVSFELNRDGGLENLSLLKTSEVKEINNFAEKIVKIAAPYPEFKKVFGEKTDIVVITESLQFNVNNKDKSVEKSN